MADRAALASETVAVNGSCEPREILRSYPGAPLFYWENPSRRFAIAAVGVAAEVMAAGPDRFRQASEATLEILSSIERRGAKPAVLMAVGGFSFSDFPSEAPEWREFPPLRLVVPRLLWVRRGSICHLTRVSTGEDHDEPEQPLCDDLSKPNHVPPAVRWAASLRRMVEDSEGLPEWRVRVDRVRSLIADRALRKVVLARSLRVNHMAAVKPEPIIAAALESRPSCFSFWLRGGETSLVGSTPELLVRLQDGRVSSSALAGSAPRGATPAEDRALGLALLASPKERLEHRLVVSGVTRALGRVIRELTMPETPELMLLPEAQHLYTPITGRLQANRTAIELVGMLHPTAAVCGVPVEAARRIIEREEPGRGWYTGGVGWMGPDGEGEFATVLRSALFDGDSVSLWAGAGIVEGSDPDAEFVETRAKMAALFGRAPRE